MKKSYLEPRFDLINIQGEDFLSSSPDYTDKDVTDEEFTGGTSGEITPERPPSIFG